MRRHLALVTVATAVAAACPAPAAVAKPATFTRLFTVSASTARTVGIARAANGALHLIFQTFAGRAFSGLAAESISPAGHAGPLVQALSVWQAGVPGLIAFPNGQIEAIFGAIQPTPPNTSSVWGITSTNGGATWSAPVDVRSGPNEALAYGSDVGAVLSAAGPVLSLPQAGNIVIQRGFGPGSPTYQVTNQSNGATTDDDLATDAATHQVIAGWKSIAKTLVEYMQAVSPTLGPVQAVPGQDRNTLSLAGRDKGAGVFGAYTPDGTHVRLLRYGGGSVAVGSARGVTAKALGVATGLGGRIWVMWGTDSPSAIAVTRSNRAVTRFEPIQRLDPKTFSLYRIDGDGRLGPLDLLVTEIGASKGPIPPPGEFYAHVLPVLSAGVSVHAIKNKKGKVITHVLQVTVTDAGDAVPGATVAAVGIKHKTNSKGRATIVVPATKTGTVTVTVTDPGYQLLTTRAKL